jgi:lactate dehydrogenase-like 2-hydroxyacid dehydrogenase
MRYTVVLTGELPAIATSLLSPHVDVIAHATEASRSEEDLAMLLAEADAAIVLPSDPITRHVLESNPNLRMVVNFGAGYDNIDLQAARELGVTVTNTPGEGDDDTARTAATNVLLFLRGAFRESAE